MHCLPGLHKACFAAWFSVNCRFQAAIPVPHRCQLICLSRANNSRRPANALQHPPSPARPRRRRQAARQNRTSQHAPRLTHSKVAPKMSSKGLKSSTVIQRHPRSLQQWEMHSLDIADGLGPPSKLDKGQGLGHEGKHSGEENCRLMAMVEHISSLVSNLAHAWGFIDIATGMGLPSGYCTAGGVHNNMHDLLKEELGRGEAGDPAEDRHQQESVSAEGRDEDALLSELVQKTLLQLMLLVPRMGDPSCMWALWAPGWGNDRSIWGVSPDQHQWCDAYGLSSSCEGEGVPVLTPYQSTLVPTDMMGSVAPAGRCSGPPMMDCPAVPRPKWAVDSEERVPGPYLGHQLNGWQQTSQVDDVDRRMRGEAPAEGDCRLSGVQWQAQEERVGTKVDKRSALKRGPGFRAPLLRQAKAVRRSVRRSVGWEEQDENDGEGGEGKMEPSLVHEIDEMAVAEALLCMSGQPSK